MTKVTYDEDYTMTLMGNFVRYVCDGVCISYNPSTNLNQDHMPETAVVIGEGEQKFYICYGDKRNYFNGANTLDSIKARCRELKRDPSFWIGFWSDDWEELDPQPQDKEVKS